MQNTFSNRHLNLFDVLITVHVICPTAELQWWFVYPDMFVPGRHFRIKEFSRITELPISLDMEIGSLTFFQTSKISGLSEPALRNHHCTCLLLFIGNRLKNGS